MLAVLSSRYISEAESTEAHAHIFEPDTLVGYTLTKDDNKAVASGPRTSVIVLES